MDDKLLQWIDASLRPIYMFQWEPKTVLPEWFLRLEHKTSVRRTKAGDTELVIEISERKLKVAPGKVVVVDCDGYLSACNPNTFFQKYCTRQFLEESIRLCSIAIKEY